jgi:hypothetical protein
MSSQSIPAEALNAYDDQSHTREDNSRLEHEYDSTRRPEFPPAEDRGFNFQPLNMERRDLKVNQLPQEPLHLFQHFVPLSLVNSWVQYSNSWVNSLLERSVIDSRNHELKDRSRLQSWKPTCAAEVYIWLGILIYIGIHKEIAIEDHWKTPKPGEQRAEQSIIKFMTGFNSFIVTFAPSIIPNLLTMRASLRSFNAHNRGLSTYNMPQRSSVSRALVSL